MQITFLSGKPSVGALKLNFKRPFSLSISAQGGLILIAINKVCAASLPDDSNCGAGRAPQGTNRASKKFPQLRRICINVLRNKRNKRSTYKVFTLKSWPYFWWGSFNEECSPCRFFFLFLMLRGLYCDSTSCDLPPLVPWSCLPIDFYLHFLPFFSC